MVLIDGVKFACQSCIKGHRSTKCTHTTRPLVEIKKKGRPTSQCSHCRDLRKTRSVHGKCDCAGRELEEKPQKAVLPNGIVDLIRQPLLDDEQDDALASSSDKKKGGFRVSQLLNPCNCRRGGKCNCCTVVDRSKKSRLSIDSTASSSAAFPVASTSRSRSASRTRNNGSSGCCSSKAKSGTASPAVYLATPSSTASSDAFSPPSSSSFFFSSPDLSPYPTASQPQPFASTSYLPAAPTPLSQTFSPAFPYSQPSVQSPSVLGPTTQLGGCIGDDPTCTLLLAHLQANAPPPTHQTHSAHPSAFSIPHDVWSSTPFAQSFIPHQTPLFLPHTQGTNLCFCGDSCTCVGCPQHDPLGQKRSPSHEPGPGCGCRNRAAQSAPPPLNVQTTQLQPSGKRVCCRANSNAEVPSDVTSIDQLLQSVMDLASPCEITGSNQCAMSLPGLWNEGGNEAIVANLPGVNDIWSGQLTASDPWFETTTNPEAPQALPLFIAPEQRQKRKAKAQSVWALEPLPETIYPWSSNANGAQEVPSSYFPPALKQEANGCSSMYAPAIDASLGQDEEDLEPGCGDQCQCASTCACRMVVDEDELNDAEGEGEEGEEGTASSTPLSRDEVQQQEQQLDEEVPTRQMAATSLGDEYQTFTFEGFTAEDIEGSFGERPNGDQSDQGRASLGMVDFVAAGFC